MPFQSGQSGNPGGRPKKGFDLASRLARFGYKKNPETQHRYYDDMVTGIWKRAAKGDMEATKYIMDRVLGRPAQEILLPNQQPTLVFQIIDPRLPLPEPQQDTVEGEVLDRPGVFKPVVPDDVVQAEYRDPDHQDPDSET